MPATVVLEHTLPDGTGHFDWMIEDPCLGAEHRLATWRTAIHPERAATGQVFAAERIGAHRARYLTYEGPLSGERGRVRRVGSGWAEWVKHTEKEIEILIGWHDGRSGHFRGRSVDGVRWAWHHDPA
jgi:hypothetical protein